VFAGQAPDDLDPPASLTEGALNGYLESSALLFPVHDVRIVSRSGTTASIHGAVGYRGNVFTGDRFPEAMNGVEIVIHCVTTLVLIKAVNPPCAAGQCVSAIE